MHFPVMLWYKKNNTLSKGNPVEIELLDSISFWKKNLLQQEFIWLSGNNGIVQLLKADTGDLFLGKKKKTASTLL